MLTHIYHLLFTFYYKINNHHKEVSYNEYGKHRQTNSAYRCRYG